MTKFRAVDHLSMVERGWTELHVEAGIPHLAKNERGVGQPSVGGRERIKEATLD
jgi:hypothetical protein